MANRFRRLTGTNGPMKRGDTNRVPRVRRVYLLCFLIALSGPAPAQTQNMTEKSTEFGIGVETGFGTAQYHDTCIDFRVFFVAGQFFKGLRKVKSPNGLEFRKGRETYRTFPDKLVVDLEALALKCSATTDRLPPPEFASGLLNEVSIDVNWKTGPEMRPIAVLWTKTIHRTSTVRWDYILEIPAKDVPLTDQLVVDVSARDRIRLCRVTSNLK
jgi:hypothetical protein